MNYSIKYAKNILQKYRLSNMFKYYFKRSFIIFCVILLILGLLISSFVLNTTINAYKNDSYSAVSQIDTYISALFEDAATSARFISEQSNAVSFLYSKNIIPPSTPLAQNISSLQKLMNSTLYSSSHLDSIYFYSIINDFVVSTRNSASADKFYDKTFLEYFKNTGEVNFFIPSSLHTTNGNNIDVISCAYGIYDVNIPIGMIVFNIKTERIRDIISSSGLDFHNFNIYNSNGDKIFAANDNSPSYTSGRTFCFSDRGVLMIQNTDISSLNLRFGIEMLSYRSIVLYILITLSVCIILTIVLSAVSALYISANFYSSIENIILLLQNNDNNETNDIYDDMQFIADNITKYIRDKENLTHRLTTQIAQYKHLQSYTLQLQFNPHFLFNTLNIIGLEMYKISGKHTPANTVLSCLADLLEISLDNKKSIVNFYDEVSYAQKYLAIQSICDDTFDVVLDISDNAYKTKVPKLILQPVLENAITHGIKYLMHKKRGIIKISAEINEQMLIITICDNGIGMSSDKLNHIRNQLKNNDIPSSTHIGLCNVFQRLKLIFDTQCDLTVDSLSDQGTTVKIKIPAEYDNSPTKH